MDTSTGNGASCDSSLAIQFSVSQNIEYEFSAYIDGDRKGDNIQLKGPTGFASIHLVGDGAKSYPSPGKRTLIPGNYVLTANCEGVGSSRPGWRRGAFHFQLRLYATVCSDWGTLNLDELVHCRSQPGDPAFPAPQFANGRLEFTCDEIREYFKLIWHDVNGVDYFIGVCRYDWGENYTRYSYNRCLNTLTSVEFENHEGHVDHNPYGLDCPDYCHGTFPNLYEIDRYVFTPEQIHFLEIKKYTRRLGFYHEFGPRRERMRLFSGPAPERIEDLINLPSLHLDGNGCVRPRSQSPVRTVTYLSGTASGGHIYVNARDRSFGLWLQGGETTDSLAGQLAELINADADLALRQVVASSIAASEHTPAGLILANVTPDELSFSVTGQGNTGLRFVSFADFPLLEISRSANTLTLLWETNSLNFIAETTSNLADAQSWVPVGDQPFVTAGTNVLTMPLAPGSHFYRLRLP